MLKNSVLMMLPVLQIVKIALLTKQIQIVE